MKYILFILSFTFVFTACKEKKEPLQLPIEKLYILEGGHYRSSDKYDESISLVEIDSLFNIRITTQKEVSSPYLSNTINISDSLKYNLIELVNSFQTDTLYYSKIYDTPIYSFSIERKSNKFTHIWGTKFDLPPELQKIQKYFFNDTILNKVTQIIPNQDSITQRMADIRYFVFPPPPRPKNISEIEFTPPSESK
ncbi:MAG: hypothetical protein ACK5M3_07415 [Dysgonomonas sp.]